jgi:hypothetical protein
MALMGADSRRKALGLLWRLWTWGPWQASGAREKGRCLFCCVLGLSNNGDTGDQ